MSAEYQTDVLDHASYLLASGHTFLGLAKINPRHFKFRFANHDAAEAAVVRFVAGEGCSSAKALLESMRHLRAITFNANQQHNQ